jgi:hypothetical protein
MAGLRASPGPERPSNSTTRFALHFIEKAQRCKGAKLKDRPGFQAVNEAVKCREDDAARQTTTKYRPGAHLSYYMMVLAQGVEP